MKTRTSRPSRQAKNGDAFVRRLPRARSRITNGKDILAGVADHRVAAARRYQDLVALAVADQGGLEGMSEARLQLIRRFAALSVQAEAMETRLANGETLDISEYACLTSTLVRVIQRLGINRNSKLVVVPLRDYLETKAAPPTVPSPGAAR
jgi:hypothetical protein